MYSSETQNQKEKHESELKKEIKKLQRYRDSIKGWIQLNEIKDKTQLLDARKSIERQMERFKVCEKETKTKAYSKEGLYQASKLNPKDQAKHDAREWLNATVGTLNTQIDEYEFEIEGLQGSSRKKQRNSKIDDLEQYVALHREHVGCLEQMIRGLDNEAITPEDADEVKDLVEDYLERHQDSVEEFEYVDDIYGDILDRLDEHKPGSAKKGGLRRDEEPEEERGQKDADSGASAGTVEVEVVKKKSSKSPGKSGGGGGGGQEVTSAASDAVKGLQAPLGGMGQVRGNFQAQSAAALGGGGMGDDGRLNPGLGRISMNTLLPNQRQTVPFAEPGGMGGHGRPDVPADQMKFLNRLQSQGSGFGGGQGPMLGQAGLERTGSSLSGADGSDVGGLAGDPAIVKTQKRAKLPDSVLLAQQKVQASVRHVPLAADRAWKPSHRPPPHPAQMPASYPKSCIGALNGPQIYEKLEIEALFFAFYFKPGSVQQYLAANELKRNTWRFNRKYNSWFQRQKEPRLVSNEREQGSVVYFDHNVLHEDGRPGWCARVKEDFTFEYRDLVN